MDETLHGGFSFFHAKTQKNVFSSTLNGCVAQLMIVAIHIGTALLDQSFWDVPTSSFWQTREAFEPVTFFGSTFTFSYTDCFCYFTVFVAVAKYVCQ